MTTPLSRAELESDMIHFLKKWLTIVKYVLTILGLLFEILWTFPVRCWLWGSNWWILPGLLVWAMCVWGLGWWWRACHSSKSFARFCGKVRIISPYNSDIFKMPHVFFRGPSIYLTFVRKDIWFKMLRLRMGNFHWEVEAPSKNAFSHRMLARFVVASWDHPFRGLNLTWFILLKKLFTIVKYVLLTILGLLFSTQNFSS